MKPTIKTLRDLKITRPGNSRSGYLGGSAKMIIISHFDFTSYLKL